MSAPNSPDSFIFSSEEEREELKQQIKEEKETASDKNSDIYSGEERKEEAKQKIKKEKNKRIIYDSTNSETDSYEKIDEDDRKQIRRNERDGRKQKKKTENEGKRNDTKEGKKHSAKEKRRKSKKNENELNDKRKKGSAKAKINKSAFERDKKRDHDIEKIIKREEEDDSERESKNKRMKTPEEQITEEVSANSLLQQTQKNDESKQSTLHHTFKVDCTKCKVEVSTKDLGDTAISPTCVSWAVECSSCTGSKANVTRYGQYTFKMTVLRALFLLHVKNPQREYWQISEVANIMRGSSAEDFKRATENSEKLKNGFSASIGNVLARFSFAGTLKHHDKGLYMYIYPLVNSDENSARPSITSAKPGQSADTRKEDTNFKGKQSQPLPKFPQQTTLKSAAKNMSITWFFNTMRERDQPEPSAHNTSSTLPVMQEVFVGWLGKEEFIGFVIVNLDLPLKALRSEIMADHIVKHDEFLFYYKMSPVQVCQETKMLIRACVTENNDSFHVRLVCLAKK